MGITYFDMPHTHYILISDNITSSLPISISTVRGNIFNCIDIDSTMLRVWLKLAESLFEHDTVSFTYTSIAMGVIYVQVVEKVSSNFVWGG